MDKAYYVRNRDKFKGAERRRQRLGEERMRKEREFKWHSTGQSPGVQGY